MKQYRSTHDTSAYQPPVDSFSEESPFSGPVLGLSIGIAALSVFWDGFTDARGAFEAPFVDDATEENLPREGVVRMRPGLAGGKTDRPFPLEAMLAAIPEGGSLRNGKSKSGGYPTMSDEDLLVKLSGFWAHKGRGLKVHDVRLFQELTESRCLRYVDFANKHQIEFGQGLPLKYRRSIFTKGLRRTAHAEVLVWMLLRAHTMKKLGLYLSASQIAMLANEDPHSTSHRTVWRAIERLEARGLLVRTNTYHNRKMVDGKGRPVNYGSNVYIAGPRLLELFNAETSPERHAERLKAARRATRARYLRHRRGEGSEPEAQSFLSFGEYVLAEVDGFEAREGVRVEVELAEVRSRVRLAPIADAFREHSDWTLEGAGPLFEEVAVNRELMGAELQVVREGFELELLAAEEPEHLREAASVVAQLRADDPDAVEALAETLGSAAMTSAMERVGMLEPPEEQASVGEGGKGRCEEAVEGGSDWRVAQGGGGFAMTINRVLEGQAFEAPVPCIGRATVHPRTKEDCAKAASTYHTNTMSLWHGVPFGTNGEQQGKAGTSRRPTPHHHPSPPPLDTNDLGAGSSPANNQPKLTVAKVPVPPEPTNSPPISASPTSCEWSPLPVAHGAVRVQDPVPARDDGYAPFQDILSECSEHGSSTAKDLLAILGNLRC